MREAMDPWIFVMASYAIGLAATFGMVGWALVTMRRAEKRRDDTRRQDRGGAR